MNQLLDRHGMGLVGVMLALSLLGILALVAAQLASNERQTSWNEWVHVGSFHSADSGGEAAIGWLLATRGAPPMPNFGANDRTVNMQSSTQLEGSQRYSYRMEFNTIKFGAGNSINLPELYYKVDAEGKAGAKGNSNIELTMSKRVPMGYSY
jgi:hypothetical protein